LTRKLILLLAVQLFFIGINYGQSVQTDSSLSKRSEERRPVVPDPIFQDTLTNISNNKNSEKDIRDLLRSIFKPNAAPLTGDEARDDKKHFSGLPAVGYTLQTGFAALVTGNMAYYTDTLKDTKISSINASVAYSQYNQIIIPLQASIWTKKNRFNLITDLRFIDYPSDIYGLGGQRDPNTGYTLSFTGIKIHQTIMKYLSDNVYVGVGYYFDHFYGIRALNKVSNTVQRRIVKELGTNETASGPSFRFIYDSRLNQINPKQGLYYSMTFRTSEKSLGSDSAWSSIQIDSRAYFPFPAKSGNILAFWMFDWLTSNGTPPYLLLPSTGWDDSYNTGRGYIQSRFRGRNMIYFESEYRYNISRNGLVGGVLFTNLESFSGDISRTYSNLFAGYGLGLRLKLNKYSNANVCIDYGFGQNGSHGLFVNVGEVF
jgi:hypothetical protein